MARIRDRGEPQPTAQQLVPYLKERIYVSFIGLAVLLALSVHGEETEAFTAVTSLLIAAVGAGLAGLISEIVAHLAVKGSLPDATELRFLVRVSSGALATIVLPVVILLLAAAGVLSVPLALTVAVWIMAVTLGAIGYIAVFRASLAWWKKLAVFLGLVLFGLVVVGVQLLAHG
ncbi:hypothetical protein GCM10027413_21230 [Conyzicola nivalis]|uniref:Uncharacterized protein n=1 Tax=Conyzicola nivalis TaxID=1477021 RepID=A0A916SCP3_9MICO|nr:hypothetical protein [Conyzicola nivalis]GGA93742.1 hypothetical protein GCM10010979_05390 [Conyzicola nivalis]